jgi:hypothetical protein
MTGFKSKKTSALDEEGMYLVHQTAQPAQAEQCKYPDCKCPTENPCLKGLAQPEQEPVIVSADADADEMNRQYGDRYGFDWKYPDETLQHWKYPDKTPQQPESKRAAAQDKLAQPAQEPVAWPCVIAEANFEQNTITLEMQCTDYKVGARQHWLCTTPPQRPWVDLTDEEISALSKGHMTRNGFARNVLAKSKEKNNG